jgi:peroxiredoxin
MLARLVAIATIAATSACAHSVAVGTRVASPPLQGTDGATHALAPAGDARLAVLVFFAAHCPCQAAHDARLRDLFGTYHPRGVDFFAVDSEVSATPERDQAEASRRGYSFPILLDRGGALARQLDAEYATEVFVVDRAGAVRYHGGIDSDKRNLHDDATPFLRDALDDLLEGRPMRRTESKALGCALQTW